MTQPPPKLAVPLAPMLPRLELDADGEKAARRALEQRVRGEAAKIASKYIRPPLTVEFAVLYLPTRFGLGFMLPPALGPSAAPTMFGHPGAGGSLALGDPQRGLGFAYVMNRMSLATAGDPRADGLVAALGRCPGA